MVQLSYPYMTTGKTIALTICTFVNKVLSLRFNVLSRFVIVFLPRSKCLLILWLQSLSTVILKSKKIKSITGSTFSLSFCQFPGGLASKESACDMGDLGSIPRLGRSPGEGKDYPFQYSGLENSMDCIVHANSRLQLSDFHFVLDNSVNPCISGFSSIPIQYCLENEHLYSEFACICYYFVKRIL